MLSDPELLYKPRTIFKGGFKSENVEEFVNLPKNIPKNYLKFVHPVHDIDKTSILNFFDFTSLTYLHALQRGFQDHYKKSYIVKAFYTYKNKQQWFYSIFLFRNCDIF